MANSQSRKVVLLLIGGNLKRYCTSFLYVHWYSVTFEQFVTPEQTEQFVTP